MHKDTALAYKLYGNEANQLLLSNGQEFFALIRKYARACDVDDIYSDVCVMMPVYVMQYIPGEGRTLLGYIKGRIQKQVRTHYSSIREYTDIDTISDPVDNTDDIGNLIKLLDIHEDIFSEFETWLLDSLLQGYNAYELAQIQNIPYSTMRRYIEALYKRIREVL